MDVFDVFKELFDAKVMRIIQVFLTNPDTEFYLKEISSKSRVSIATTFRILQRLLNVELITERRIKTLKLFKLGDNEKTRILKDSLDIGRNAMDYFISKIQKVEGVLEVIQHGNRTDTKANLLILGRDINLGIIKSLVGEIKSKYNFTIIYLTLEPEQFEQMSNMGLYSGAKKVIYHKM